MAYDFLKNANIAAGGVLPMCQDTGTVIIMGKKGRLVFTDGEDEAALAEGARDSYLKRNLRYSQLAPISMFEEKNTRSNMPAQVEIYAEVGGDDAYKFLFVAKGGGSANKSFLFQATPSILTHDRMLAFLKEKILTLGTAACPPYHLAIVIGGTSAELTMKTVKLASCRYLDALPTQGSEDGHAFRDLEMEREVHKLTQSLGRRRPVRRQVFLPRRAGDPAAAPRRLAADRARRLLLGRPPGARQDHPRRHLPRGARAQSGAISARARRRDAGRRRGRDRSQRPMPEILAQLPRIRSRRGSLTGPLVVARDLGACQAARAARSGQGLPDYFKNHPVYYAGPAKTPEGYASGSFGPTTAGRIDSFVDEFQAAGGSLVMLAKGNRSARCARPARSTAASISPRSAGPPPTSPSTASRRSRCSNIPSSAWRRSGASRSRTSPPSSSSTTRATTSSRSSIWVMGDGVAP